MIEIEDIHKTFDRNPVLKGVSLSINKREVVAIIGRSGCGKSVLLKHVVGLMKPDRGSVWIDGHNMSSGSSRDLVQVRERVGFLFQGGALFDSMTVFENVAFPLKEKTKMDADQIRERVLGELGHVGLTGAEDKFPSQISGGMIKRAALARGLVSDPEIMLFDEPTTGLDPITNVAILKLIDQCHKRLSFGGMIVTHDNNEVFKIVDRVVMLHDGLVLIDAAPQAFLQSDEPMVRAFLGKQVYDGLE